MSNSRPTFSEVVALANVQLDKAGGLYRKSRWLQVATFALGVAAIFIANPYTYVPALLALGVQACAWSARHDAGDCHSRGEEGRRWGLLMDSLGGEQERVDFSNWLDQVSPRQGEAAPDPVPSDYFASTAATGLRRLCDHLQENAFWNKLIYKEAANYYGKFLAVFVVAAIGATLVAIPLTADGQDLVLARIIVASLASGAAYTQWSEVRSWRAVATKSELLDRRLDALSECTDPELRSGRIGTVLSAYADYCVSTSGAPPVPTWVYKRHRAHINEIWVRRSAT